MKFLVLNGPNLNFLGIRETSIYGVTTYSQMCDSIEEKALGLGVEVEFFQSNHEGALVDKIQYALGNVDGMIINPAAYTHTSVAILDALKAVNLPTVEVHLSDIATREEFRQHSYAGMACQWHFVGLGIDGYFQGLEVLKAHLEKNRIPTGQQRVPRPSILSS